MSETNNGHMGTLTLTTARRLKMFYDPDGKRGPKRKYNPIEVIQLLADGSTTHAVAQKYGVRSDTIRVILHSFMKQHNVHTTTQLVAHFLRNGWVD